MLLNIAISAAQATWSSRVQVQRTTQCSCVTVLLLLLLLLLLHYRLTSLDCVTECIQSIFSCLNVPYTSASDASADAVVQPSPGGRRVSSDLLTNCSCRNHGRRATSFWFQRSGRQSAAAPNTYLSGQDCSQLQLYTGCPRRNVKYFGRVFLMLNYTDITQNTYIQS